MLFWISVVCIFYSYEKYLMSLIISKIILIEEKKNFKNAFGNIKYL